MEHFLTCTLSARYLCLFHLHW